MTAGETLLKITDFPFAYSFTALIVGTLGLNIQNENIIIFLASAGSLGTFLSVTDPLGRLLKWILKKVVKRRKRKDPNSISTPEQSTSAIYSRSIGIEVDKLVALGYFVIVLYLFSSFMNTNPSFAEQFQLIQKDGNVLCDTDCISEVGNVIGYLGAIAVLVVGLWNWKELQKQIEIAGIHQLGIGSEFVTHSTIENMGRAIQQNDWQTAKEWADIIENEIKTEKGKKDFNIEAVREVYRPLFEESIQIQATIQLDIDNDTFSTLPAKQWPRIRGSTANIMIKDENLRKEIETFYKKIVKYNRIVSSIEKEIQDVIRTKGTEFYGKPIETVSYWFKHNGSGSAPALWDCLRRGKHPREIESKKPVTTTYIELQFPERKTEHLDNKEDFEKFDKFWKILVDEVKEKTSLLELKKFPFEIKKMNNELQPKIEKQISKQWL